MGRANFDEYNIFDDYIRKLRISHSFAEMGRRGVDEEDEGAVDEDEEEGAEERIGEASFLLAILLTDGGWVRQLRAHQLCLSASASSPSSTNHRRISMRIH